MLELLSINKEVESFRLQNVYLTIKKGDYWVLLGNSGSGKTLLLEIIAGITRPDSGKIMYEGKNILNSGSQKKHIGIVFDDYAIFPHMSVRDNIMYPLKIKGTNNKDIAIKIGELAGLVGIAHLLNKKPEQLSKGELQRLAIARTLAADPEIILLDQPLAMLDIQLRGEIRRLLRTLNQNGYTIIHVTQEYEEAIALANKVAIMNKGYVVQAGELSEVFNKPKSQFVANFIGINNYFPAQLFKNRTTNQKAAIVSDSLEIMIQTEKDEGFGFIMIREDQILLSEMKQQSYMRNNFKGTILEISRSKYGMCIILDIGMRIFASITEKTHEALQLSEGKTTWVSFRVDDVVFIET